MKKPISEIYPDRIPAPPPSPKEMEKIKALLNELTHYCSQNGLNTDENIKYMLKMIANTVKGSRKKDMIRILLETLIEIN